MDSVYTSTITNAAKKRGIDIQVVDKVLPVFSLSYRGRNVRCYNGLTDMVGAATFHLANDKGASNRFLHEHGFPVPAQVLFTNMSDAIDFMSKYRSIVVKPVSQWGGRGVSTHISKKTDLKKSIIFAQRYCDEVVLEECVSGTDWRLIFVNCRFICAIQRDPAAVLGNGIDTIDSLIKKKNFAAKLIDPSNLIPLDKETTRCIETAGITYDYIPANQEKVVIRRTSNYHTGGTVSIITEKVGKSLIDAGERIAKLLNIPVLGVDMLVNNTNQTYRIIELSPDMAISPPEGEIVAEAFLDYLFPESKRSDDKSVKKILKKKEIPVNIDCA